MRFFDRDRPEPISKELQDGVDAAAAATSAIDEARAVAADYWRVREAAAIDAYRKAEDERRGR